MEKNDENSDQMNSEYELEIGDHFMVKWRWDNSWHSAEVIEMRLNSSENGRYEYYVHYEDYNKRLDEWVGIDRFDLHRTNGNDSRVKIQKETVKSGTVCCVSDSIDGTDRKITRNQKQNHIQKTIAEIDRSTGALERDEAITRVKKVDRIRFGKYEIECCYFSPFPLECGKQPKLWICEYCLKPMGLEKTYRCHQSKCCLRQIWQN